ncbi:hypothetical protein IFR05_017596, partial [Cadophora sp. M221]
RYIRNTAVFALLYSDNTFKSLSTSYVQYSLSTQRRIAASITPLYYFEASEISRMEGRNTSSLNLTAADLLRTSTSTSSLSQLESPSSARLRIAYFDLFTEPARNHLFCTPQNLLPQAVELPLN